MPPLAQLIEYLSVHKGDCISYKHARVKAQDLGLDIDHHEVMDAIMSAGFSFTGGASQFFTKERHDEISQESV